MNTNKLYSWMLKCNNFIIDWSPKAGCTVITKIWFDYMNVLEEALETEVVHNRRLIKGWVHDFTPTFKKRFGKVTSDELKSDNFIKIKYVRNPYDRAVSSYIHCCKHPEILLGKHKDKNPTFKDFLNLIVTNKIHDDHYEIQNSFPEIKYDEIIKIENLESETKRLNEKYDIKLKCDFNSSHHVKKKNKIDNFFNIPVSDVKKYLHKNKELPTYDSFYNDETKEIVYQIYKTDIERFNYKSPY
jgi:hypothetical protein